MRDKFKEGGFFIRFITVLITFAFAPALMAEENIQSFDLGIESMRSHSYSVGIFIFMMVAIAVFVGIVIAFFKHESHENIKPGEKVMFGMIILGVVAASVFAAVQLLDGFLF